MASIFTNKFFSVAGQKERLSNVANTLKVAVTGKDLSSQKTSVIGNTKSKTANAILGASASHPFITAGVVAGGVTALKSVGTAGATAIAGSSAKGSASIIAGSTLKAGAIGVGAGIVAGSLLSGGSKSSSKPNQITTPTQNPTQTTAQTTGQTQRDDTKSSSASPFDVSGQGNKINYAYDQSVNTQKNQYSYQYASPIQTPTQSVVPTQTANAESSGDIPWIPLAIVGIGAYYLLSK